MGKVQELSLENDFLVCRCFSDEVRFTYDDLKKLHRSFGHPTVTALSNLMRRARPEEISKEVPVAIRKLTEECKVCVEKGQIPKRFKLTMGSEQARFNHTVNVDIMYVKRSNASKPEVHVVDESTHFASAKFLSNISSREVWKALMICWSHVYLGPPDYLRIDQESQFTSEEFIGSSNAAGNEVIQEPVEKPVSISNVERYHAPFHSAYEKLSRDLV